MANNITLGFSFSITKPSEFTARPEKHSTVNNFDYISDIVSLPRIYRESNVDYKKRLWDVSVHPGSPTYNGMVNNLPRSLGYLREKTISIDLKLDSSGSPIAPNPRVDLLANRIVLYKDWRPDANPVIDKTIRIYKKEDSGYFLSDLVSEINSSECFSATMFSDIRPNMNSTNLVRGTSNYQVINDPIRSDKITYLSGKYIVQGSLIFDEALFEEEVTYEPADDGEYRVNYTEGSVETYSIPSGVDSCSYHSNIFPLEIDSVPIEIYTFQDDDYQLELFDKQTLPSGEEQNALPNVEGSKTYHQLYLETKVFWGR